MNRKIFKAGVGYTIGNFMIKGLSFLTLPLFARLLSIQDYGRFSVYLSYESIIYIFIGLAMHSCIKTAKYKYGADFNAFLSSVILGIILNFLIAVIGINIVYPLYRNVINFSLLIINILLVHSFGSALITFYNNYVGLDYKYQNYLFLSCFNAGLNVLLSLFFMKTIFADNAYLGRILGTVIPVIFILFYIVHFFFKQEKPRFNKSYYKFALKYSLPIIPHGLSQVILSQSDRIMIDLFVNSTATGLYSFAFNIYSILSIIVQSVCSVWEPWVFEQLAKDNDVAVKKSGDFFSMGILLFTVLTMLVSPELIIILGSRAYEASKLIAIPILAGGFFSSMYNIPCVIEYYREKTKMIAFGTAMAAVINIFLNYIFIRKWGYVAAAFTTMFTYFLYFSFHYVIAYRISNCFIIDKKLLCAEICILLTAAAATAFFIENLLLRWSGAVFIIFIILFLSLKRIGIQRIKYFLIK